MVPCPLCQHFKLGLCMKSTLPTIAAIGLISHSFASIASGQNLLSLEALQPSIPSATSEFSQPTSSVPGTPVSYSQLPSVTDSSNITLQAIPQANAAPQVQQPNGSQINLALLKPAAKSADPKAGQLQVDSMIRQQQDSTYLFSKLNIDNSFLASATVAPTQRGQTADGYSLEWSPQGYGWHSPAFCHRTLYFEQPNYERYGTRNPYYLAPTLSAAHFFGTAAILPVKALYHAPWCKSCTLGNKRPGDCSPIQRPAY